MADEGEWQKIEYFKENKAEICILKKFHYLRVIYKKRQEHVQNKKKN